MRPLITSLFILFSWCLTQAQTAENIVLLDQWDDPAITDPGGWSRYNEVWGLVQGEKEYAVLGSILGTHFFEITDNDQLNELDLVYGGFFGNTVVHRDYHDYNGYLYAVCDEGLTSTLQIIDLQYLPDSAHVVYDSPLLVSTAHNIFIDSATAKLYVCGPVGNAMSIYSLQDPVNPVLLSHFNFVTYVHDAYVRNDTAYLNCGPDGLHIFRFTNPSSPIQLGSLTSYPDQGYNHSGWLSEDGKTYIFADETVGMKMKVCDVSDLTDIQVVSLFGTDVYSESIPHNQIWKDGIAYVSHYQDGLQIFNLRSPSSPNKIGFYDTYPTNMYVGNGAWGIYPFLPSERLLVSDRQTGLYLFHFKVPPKIESEEDHGIYPNPISNVSYFHYRNPRDLTFTLNLFNSQGQLVRQYQHNTADIICISKEGLASGIYFYEYIGEDSELDLKGKFIISAE